MTIKIILRIAAVIGVRALCLPLCNAQVTQYNNESDFLAALSSGYGTPNVTNFDSLTAGMILPNGSTVQGTTLNYTPGSGSFEMQVQGPPYSLINYGIIPDTTSPPNSLGTNGDGVFLSGDQLTMTFAQPEQAVGLFVISGGDDLPGDFTLSVTQGSVTNSIFTDSTYGTLADGGNVYFVGLTEDNPTQSFTSATFSSLDDIGVPFNLDDITSAAAKSSSTVPDAASTCGLLLSAFAGLMALRRRRS